MSRRVYALCALIVAAALLVSGCGLVRRALGRAVDEAVGEVTEGLATAVAPTPDSGAVAEAPSSPPEEPVEPDEDEESLAPEEVTAFDRLDSYRLTQVLRWRVEEEDGVDEGEITWDVAFVREPPARHYRMSGREGPDTEEESHIELIQVGEDTYTSFGDEWIAMTSDEEMVSPWVQPPGAYVSRDSERVGTETMNGYESIHYRAAEDASLMGLGSVETADYWVSVEHDVIVRSVVEWVGSDGADGQGRWTMQWDLTDINEPIAITAPEGVDKPGLPDDVPLMPGATNVSSMMGMTSFDTDATAEEVLEYYKEALDTNGWSFDSTLMDTMHSFTKEGRSLTLVIDPESTPLSVMLAIDEG